MTDDELIEELRRVCADVDPIPLDVLLAAEAALPIPEEGP